MNPSHSHTNPLIFPTNRFDTKTVIKKITKYCMSRQDTILRTCVVIFFTFLPHNSSNLVKLTKFYLLPASLISSFAMLKVCLHPRKCVLINAYNDILWEHTKSSALILYTYTRARDSETAEKHVMGDHPWLTSHCRSKANPERFIGFRSRTKWFIDIVFLSNFEWSYVRTIPFQVRRKPFKCYIIYIRLYEVQNIKNIGS